MLYLGIDVGTTSVKAAAYDRSGEKHAMARVAAETLMPHPGWSEQDMDAVWSAVVAVIRQIAGAVDPTAIAAIGLSGQGDGLWALDGDRRPVRNAILWNDQRASDIVSRWADAGVVDAIAKSCRTALWPGTNAAAYAWLKANDPDTAGRIDVIVSAKDWIGHRLTGELATDYTDASIAFLDLQSKTYSDNAFARCGVPELAGKLLPPRPSAAPLGALQDAVAAELGLKAGTPVAVGALDIAAMYVGAGLNDVGDALLILGTTAVVSTVTSPSPLGDRIVGATVVHVTGDRWLNVQAPQSGTSALDWFCEQFRELFPGGAPDLVALAGTAPPGANGVLFLPYLTGERAPFVAPDATGSFLGLRATSTSADMARAVLEGVAFSLRHCLDETGIAERAGFVVTGGGARSGLWRQILADVMNTTIHSPAEDELGLLGAARLGAHAIGALDAFAAGPSTDTAATPREPQAMAQMESQYASYRAAIDALAPGWS